MSVIKAQSWVRSIGVLAAAALVLVALVPAAQANLVTVTRVSGSYTGSGGEFNLTPQDGPALGFVAGAAQLPGHPDSFQSFCLEKNENVSGGATYHYVINTGAVRGGNGGQDPVGGDFDPLSPITAWLYSSFINGTLTDYDYTVGSAREDTAGALQNAIWYSEDEIGSLPSGLATTFYNAAVAAAPTSIGNVRVLNLYDRNGGYHQDQLIMVPTPSTILLGLPLLGLIGLFRLVRRRR